MQANEREWARLWEATADRLRLDPRDGFAAFAAANERGDFAAARVVALQTLDLARSLATSSSDAPNSRGLAIALDNVGEIEAQLGDLEAARAAYGESLELRRRLRASLGDAPQVLRDVSVSLDNVGGVEAELGDLERRARCTARASNCAGGCTRRLQTIRSLPKTWPGPKRVGPCCRPAERICLLCRR